MNCVIGARIDPEYGALRSCFRGQLGSFYFFHEAINKEQASVCTFISNYINI